MDKSESKRLALVALLLISFAPTVSVTTGFALKAGVIGSIVFVATKLWMFVLPAVWHSKVEGKELTFPSFKGDGLKQATLLGLGMVVVVFLAYFLLGEKLIDPIALKEILEPFGLTIPWKLGLAVLFWIFINSVLEEYVFRWFISDKCEAVLDKKWPALHLSAAIFTLHHVIALAFFIDPVGVIIASTGVYIGGLIFSWIYLTYRSIFAAWVAHALADVAIFAIAWHLLIGF